MIKYIINQEEHHRENSYRRSITAYVKYEIAFEQNDRFAVYE
jgi:hypothetical protein